MNSYQKVYSFLWTLYFLQSMMCTLLCKVPGGVFGLMIFLVSVIFRKKLFLKPGKNEFLILILGIITFSFGYEIQTVPYAINILILPICIVFYVQTPLSYKQVLLRYLRDVMSYILFLAFPIYILLILNVSLPSIGSLSYSIYDGTNYILYFYQPFYSVRFTACFCEPGHLGMILSFLLYSQNYNLRNKKNVFLLVCLFCTLSLAAYVLALIGFFFTRQKKINFKSIFVVLGIGGFLVLIAFCIPIVKEHIVDRLVYDKDLGTIAGDNRINYIAHQYIENIEWKEFFWGIGSTTMDQLELYGTGFYMQVLRCGFISVILIFFYYLMFFFKNKVNVLNIGLLILYIISFYQRSYALWACELIIFISSTSIFSVYGKEIYDNNTK